MLSITKSPAKVNRRPAGFYDTPAPAPAPDLRLFLDERGVIVKLHIKGENAYRWHREVMTIEHPFMVKFLSAYELLDIYLLSNKDLTVRAYRLSDLTPQIAIRSSDLPNSLSELAHTSNDTIPFMGEPVPYETDDNISLPELGLKC